jgi:hypothetical protein
MKNWPVAGNVCAFRRPENATLIVSRVVAA